MTNQRVKNYLGIFFYASIFWIAVGLLHLGSLYLDALQSGESNHLSSEQWTLFISAYFTWSFLTTFLYFLIERNPPSKENFRWLLYFLLTAVIWLFIIALVRQYLVSVLWGGSSKTIAAMLRSQPPFLHLFNLLKIMMTYGACTGIFYYLRMQDARLTLLRLQCEAAEALDKNSRFQLQALQAQLSPHFLFNSLHSISGMARNQENTRIVTTVAHLASLLRYTIEGARQTQVLLADEIHFTQHYIALQAIRFEGCFNYSSQVNLTDSYVFCPPFCIQTLVENVFSHNELSHHSPVLIEVHVSQENELLVIKVENSPCTHTKNEGSGTSLKNLRERLVLLYGDKAQLVILADQHKFSATIRLPFRHEHD